MPKAPNVPTGPRAGSKGISKPMSPMPAARPTKPGSAAPGGSGSTNPKRQGETVDGGPSR